MKPYVKSRKEGGDWKAGGKRVKYHFESQSGYYSHKKEHKSFVLTFQYTFKHANDEVFIASGIPYSYSFLQQEMILFKETASKNGFLEFDINTKTKSMVGLDLPMISVNHCMTKLVQEKKKSLKALNFVVTTVFFCPFNSICGPCEF